ncbi:MAG TPA: nucleotidyltransferase domain-containing protein [Candidatus Sulfotelmatobacter sp.]|jgi:predicted nucleotidyltransferase
MASGYEETRWSKQADEFVAKAREAAKDNLLSVILYGSAAGEDFHPEYSDLNLFCVLRDASFAALHALAPVVKWWDRQRQPPPLFVTREEVQRSADVFSIELLDMKQHHRLLFGEDILKELVIPTTLRRVQVEYELREKLALLRRHLLLAQGKDKLLWETLTQSISSFVTLFRHALAVLGQEAPFSKRETVKLLAEKIGFDPSGFLHVLEVREHRVKPKELDVGEVFSHYLAAVTQVTDAVDRMLDSGVGSSSSNSGQR